ncbi:hypothetical protein [Pseudonocardia alaniniphila]|uniref:Oxidoreductase N-terminal domain-containing protein n=1 Tax=Pseudonocardia alaniniphila TaxID=75291 RepID=A0ABS9TU94_9PSEU|nr:hypothetical protein [Pseudonocardia alaniniphila]MCH6172137.1 hypothetical protein [Pseudonocardia alaniniphila]
MPPLGDGQVRMKAEWLSLDVAIRGWMNDVCSYLSPSPLGEAMSALGSGIVTESRHEAFACGDRVSGLVGRREGSPLRTVPDGVPLQAALHVLGNAGQAERTVVQ